MSDNTKKRPNRDSRISTKIYIIPVIIIALAAFVVFQVSARDKPPTEQSRPETTAAPAEETQLYALKNMYGAELTVDDIMNKFNSFMQDEGAGEFIIDKLVLSSGEKEDIYSDIKNNDDIGISMTTPKGRSAATSVAVSARGGKKKPTEFITYCFALMSVFYEEWKPEIRESILFRMIGYSENEDTPLNNEKTFIIGKNTKYIYTYSESRGLNMRIIQMPPPEEIEDMSDLPPLIR